MKQISIEWEGPISVENAIKLLNKDSDIGLYQFYGHHPIFGRDSFLYIGMTNKSFAERIFDHVKYNAMEDIYDKEDLIKDAVGYFSKVYCGRIIDPPPAREDLEKLIKDAESLLIYACTPPWNQRGANKLELAHPDLYISNFGSCGSLPPEVSTKFWPPGKFWLPDSNAKQP